MHSIAWTLLTPNKIRGRDGPACRRKIKSNILAAVLILTVLPAKVKISQAVIEHCCFLITQSLNRSDEVRSRANITVYTY